MIFALHSVFVFIQFTARFAKINYIVWIDWPQHSLIHLRWDDREHPQSSGASARTKYQFAIELLPWIIRHNYVWFLLCHFSTVHRLAIPLSHRHLISLFSLEAYVCVKSFSELCARSSVMCDAAVIGRLPETPHRHGRNTLPSLPFQAISLFACQIKYMRRQSSIEREYDNILILFHPKPTRPEHIHIAKAARTSSSHQQHRNVAAANTWTLHQIC